MLDPARDVMQLPCTSALMDGTIRQGITPSCRTPTTRAGSHDVTRALKKKQTSQSDGFSTRAHVLFPSVTCTVHPANRAHRAGHVEFHTRAHVKNPSVPNSLPSLAFVRPRDQQHQRVRFRTGAHPRSRARGGLVRDTARTTRALPCRPGTVPNETTAATRHLSRHSRSRCLHSRLALTLPRVARLILHFPLPVILRLTPGDTAACSRMATVFSRCECECC